ncbi:MAG: trigger factor [Patescibacteria group bacterium]|jgi:trigger factor
MEIKKEILPKSRIKLIINISGNDFSKYFDSAIAALGAHIEVKGFRPGKAPVNLLIEKIGESRILNQALETAIPEFYSKALDQEKIAPIASPEIKVVKYPVFGQDNELEFNAEVDVFPEVTLGDYKKLKVKKNDFEPKIINDEDVVKTIDYLRKQRSTFKKVERGAQNGDRVEIDFNGSIDHVELEDMQSKNHPVILGDKTLIPGFEEKIVGLKAGEDIEFDINFPKNYHAEKYANKKAHFKVKVNSVEEVELPVLDDKMAKDFGHKSVDELKKSIKENLQEEENTSKKNQLEGEVVTQVAKLIKAEIPAAFIENETDRLMEENKKRLEMQGMDFKTYMDYIKKTEEDLRSELKPHAEESVKIGLMLGEVIKKEGLDPKDKEAPQKAVLKLVEQIVK